MNLYRINYGGDRFRYVVSENVEDVRSGISSYVCFEGIELICNMRDVVGFEKLGDARYQRLKKLLESMIDYVLDDE